MEDFNFSGIHQSVVLPKVADKSTCALSSDERTQNDSLSQTASPIPQEIALQGDSSAEVTKVSLLPFSPIYNADGNATSVKTATGTWSISCNGENRPVRFENAGTQTVVECGYDSLGRRFEKKVTVAGTLVLHERYAYRGYLQIAAFDIAGTQTPTLKRVIYWDPTEETATRPLAVNILGDNVYFPTVDLTKNVCELVDFYGNAAATYDYAPFGNVSAGTPSGSAVPANPLQWSSEIYDSEIDLVYYNYRHYSPSLGRFLSRDPIEEQGGLNLYAFVGNNTIFRVDILGNNCCLTSLVEDLKRHEGFRSKVYKDTKGKQTIGYGFNIDDKTTRIAMERLGINVKALLSGEAEITVAQSDRVLGYLSDIAMQETRSFLGGECSKKIGACAFKIISNMMYQMGRSRLGKFIKLKKSLCSGACPDLNRATKEMLDSTWARSNSPNRAKELSECMKNEAGKYLPQK